MAARGTANKLVERVRAVVPLIAASSWQAEEQRKPVDEVIEALKRTGVFRAFVPARYGGYELDLGAFLDIGLAISEACPSTGWVTTFYMEHNWLLGLFSEHLQDEIFTAQPFVLAPGAVSPNGRATPVDDGYELSGTWKFGTGIVHADWALLSGTLSEDEVGMVHLFLVPVDEVEVKDTWHVDGMVGTGSHDIEAIGVRVPSDRVSNPPTQTWLSPPDAGYLTRIPFQPMLSLTAGMPALGCARRAVSLFRDLITERVLFGTRGLQQDRASTQIRLGRVIVEVDAAEAALRAIVREMMEHATAKRQLSLADHLRLRVAIARVVRACRDIVRDVVEGAGSKAHFLDNELQRLHRDIHMIAAHTVFDLDLVAEQYGRALVNPAPS